LVFGITYPLLNSGFSSPYMEQSQKSSQIINIVKPI